MKNWLFNSPPTSERITKFFGIIFLICLAGLFVWRQFTAPTKIATVELGGEVFAVQVVDTEAARAQGLSNTEPLAKNAGMLFVFPKPDRYSFWMKEMKYALDIIWLADNKIVDIAPRVPPPETPVSPLPSYAPRLAADRVLEVTAGTAERLNLKIGDAVKISN